MNTLVFQSHSSSCYREHDHHQVMTLWHLSGQSCKSSRQTSTSIRSTRANTMLCRCCAPHFMLPDSFRKVQGIGSWLIWRLEKSAQGTTTRAEMTPERRTLENRFIKNQDVSQKVRKSNRRAFMESFREQDTIEILTQSCGEGRSNRSTGLAVGVATHELCVWMI